MMTQFKYRIRPQPDREYGGFPDRRTDHTGYFEDDYYIVTHKRRRWNYTEAGQLDAEIKENGKDK